MAKGRWFAFGPFTLDVADERLWNDEQSVPLGHKAFAVLLRLLDEPNQLVTKEQLLEAAWPDTAVSEAVLTTAMREIRAAVGDLARTPRFVETVHGRGYRFIEPLVATNDDPRRGVLPEPLSLPTPPADGSLVGRHEEWVQLREWFAAARQGTRRVGFVCGEAGIGKTALVDAFVGAVEASTVRIARGQCIEQFGAGEPYLPVLEALGRLARDPGAAIGRVLRDVAPSWLAHFPALASAGGDLPPPVRPERMLRELTDAIEALTAAEPLILVLEDLQWSDNATVDWLAYAARRRDPARLLVLGTYRPLEAVLHAAPLRRVIAELRHQAQMSELVLDYLSRDEVTTLLHRQCGALANIEQLAEVLHRRTGGHPLFLAGIVDELLRPLKKQHASEPTRLDPAAVAKAIPLNVRRFIEHRLEQIAAEDRQILEAASVAGEVFTAAAVAAGTMLSEEHVQWRCDLLHAAGLFVEDGVVRWPDGTVGARYRFRHALFQETAYAGISPQRRAGLHLRIGEWLESTFAAEASSMAAELAVHFEQGLDVTRAAFYLEQASRNAVHRSAYTEALRHVVRALDLVETLPDGRERTHRDAALTLLQAQVLETTSGWGSEDVARAYARARELSLVLDDRAGLLQSTWGLIANCIVRAELDRTHELCRSLLALAKKRENALFRMAAHFELAGTALARGRAASARRHFRLAEALHDPGKHRSAVAAFGMDLGVFARIWASHLMWYEGWPERAGARAADTIQVSEALGHPFTHTITLAYGAMLAQFRRDAPEVDRLTTAAIALAREHGFPYYRAWAEVLRAWSLAEQGAGGEVLDGMRRSVEALGTTAGLRLPYYCGLMAEACGRFGRVDEGLAAVSSAFGHGRKSGERWWDPELHRIQGELLLEGAVANHGEAERCFRTAVDLARAQGARVLELRATVSLARLWQDQRQSSRARRVLSRIYSGFAEGFGDADLADARAWLEGSKSRSR